MLRQIGFIGLGTMGKPMAMHIAQAGYDLMVHDVRDAPLRDLSAIGAKIAGSGKELAEHSQLIEIAVLDDRQIETSLFGEAGVLAGAKPGSIIAIHSTVLPKTLEAIVENAGAKGIVVVDAPISGGELGAYEKRLCYMVGGTEEAVESCRPVFATSGSQIIHLGGVGAGTVAKIVNQILVCVNMLAVSEGMSVAEKKGLNLKLLHEVIHHSAGQSYMADHWFERMERIARSPEARRHQWEGLFKTLSVALDCAGDLGVSLPGTALTQQLLGSIVGYTK